MMRPRWRKLLGDLATERGRVALMVAAIAISLFGVGSVLGAYSILTREMPRNYLGTRPASAALEVSAGVDGDLLDEVRRRPGIAEAEAGDIVLARAKVGDDWIPLLLFVVDDFNAMRLNTFGRVSGAWPPPDGTMLIERSAEQMLQATQGSTVFVRPPHAEPRSVFISGLVHDPGLAPAWQEREGYGYITRATLALLGEQPVLGELRVTTSDTAFDLKSIEAKAQELARWLAAKGRTVEQIRVPPPGRHPHQSQMMGVLFLLLAFSAMALLLSGILVATTVSAILARQIREIGVMKTVGARSSQIASIYAVFVAILGATAVAVSIPLGVLGASALANMSATMLNLTLVSQSIPWWVFATQASAGILVPLLVAAIPIRRASRITVRQALDQHGVGETAKKGPWFSALAESGWFSRAGLLAIRNTFRRRARLVLTLTLLSAGGAMFITALNTARSWERITDRVFENRSYDVEVRLDAPSDIVENLRELPGIETVEAWGYSRTALWHPERVDVVRTYPDGSHGSLAIVGPPAETNLVRFPLLTGRWLRPGDTDAVVLNHLAASQTPNTHVGDPITLSLGGRPTTWRVVGIVEEVGSPGVAYVTDAAFARASGMPDRVRMLRLATDATSAESRTRLIRQIEHHLEAKHVAVEAVIPLSVLRTAMGDHVVILIRLLIAMAALMVMVGALGLASTIGTNVLERTREIGVMKAIGATPRQVAQLVVSEALLVALLSFLGAVAASLPLTAIVGKSVGMLAFRVRLPLTLDPGAVGMWLLLVVSVGALASWLPARRASGLTVWKALAQV
jgi:putative ABC transport system permease protein